MPSAFNRTTRHKSRTNVHIFILKYKKTHHFPPPPKKTSPPQGDITPRRGNFSSTCADSSSHCTPHGTEMAREAPTSNEKESDMAEQRAASAQSLPHHVERQGRSQQSSDKIGEKGPQFESPCGGQNSSHPAQGGIFLAFALSHGSLLLNAPRAPGRAVRSPFYTRR